MAELFHRDEAGGGYEELVVHARDGDGAVLLQREAGGFGDFGASEGKPRFLVFEAKPGAEFGERGAGDGDGDVDARAAHFFAHG